MCEVRSFRPYVNGLAKTVIAFALPVEPHFDWTKSEQKLS